MEPHQLEAQMPQTHHTLGDWLTMLSSGVQ